MRVIKKQVVLIILDGWGYRQAREYNAIAEADTPFFDLLWSTKPHALLNASGLAVGLPEGQMGNSEVGHTTIGAGRIIDTDLVRISKAVLENKLGEVKAFQDLFFHVKKYNSVCQVFGLIGPGGVHSHSEHLYGFLRAAKEAGLEKVAIHAFTDGRDTPPQSAAGYLRELEKVMDDLHLGFIATAAGRFYAMDRDNNWDRLEKAEEAIFGGRAGNIIAGKKPSEVLEELYAKDIVDEHLEPVIFLDEDGKSIAVGKNDGVFFFNYRADRARMLTKKFVDKREQDNLFVLTMTNYDDNLPAVVAFSPVGIETTLAAEISRAGLRQVHIAETEKFAHATYFLNGGRREPYENEQDILFDSRKDILTHDLAPKMRARDIADEAIKQIRSGTEFIFINFANADMVGHTAKREALIEAVEEVDYEMDRVVDAMAQVGGVSIITADHGNAEVYFDPVTDSAHTAHTSNLVPFIITDDKLTVNEIGTLADIAPTILDLYGLLKPGFMTGQTLIKKQVEN